MSYKNRFTKTELAVVLVCALTLLATLGAIGSGGRERAKRTVCLANLKHLTAAWNLYADDNDDRIVNGEAYNGGDGLCPVPISGIHTRERYWTGDDCASNYMQGEQLPEAIQIQAIRAGALYPYCKTEKLYRCPTGIRGEMRTYSIVDSMNGLARSGTISGNVGVRVGNTVLWVKKKSEIIVPSPAYRIVFLDEGRVTPDSYAVHYQQARWWDPPTVRHGEGTTVSYADGRSEYWKWKALETIKIGRMANPLHQFQPVTAAGREDLHRMQIAVWGRLGYTP